MTILTSEALASALDAVNNAVIHHAQQHQRDGTPAHPIEVAILLSVFANSISRQLRSDNLANAGYIPIPTNAIMAEGMALIGERWLREKAPERLTDLDCPSCGGSGHKGDNLDLANAPLGSMTTIGDVLHRKVENGWLIATSHRDLDRAPTHRLPLKVTDEMAKVMDGYCSDNSVGGLWAGEPQELWDRAVQAWWKSAPDMHPDMVQYNVGDFTMEMVFKPTGMTNLSDMQAVLDQVEVALGQALHPPGEMVIANGEPAVHDGEDFAPLVNIESRISPEPVKTHGGFARSVTWSVKIGDVIVMTANERYPLSVSITACKPPYEITELANNLKTALGSLPVARRK